MKLSSSSLAFLVVAGDAHDVLAVSGDEVGVVVDERLAHALGVVDVLAEDDGLVEAVGALEELGDLARHELVALLQDELAVEVASGCRCGRRSPGRTCRSCPAPAASRRSLSRSMRMTL